MLKSLKKFNLVATQPTSIGPSLGLEWELSLKWAIKIKNKCPQEIEASILLQFTFRPLLLCLPLFIGMQGETLIVAVDDDGHFTERISHFSKRYVKDADKDIIEAVKV